MPTRRKKVKSRKKRSRRRKFKAGGGEQKSRREDVHVSSPKGIFAVDAEEAKNRGARNFDVVISPSKEGYRNEGISIYLNGKLEPLETDGYDDYGHLPHWVEMNKDCGNAYFSTKRSQDPHALNLIEHNTLFPIKLSDWKMKRSTIPELWEQKSRFFKFPYKEITVSTEFERKSDGLKIYIDVPVIISAPWLGGPDPPTVTNGLPVINPFWEGSERIPVVVMGKPGSLCPAPASTLAALLRGGFRLVKPQHSENFQYADGNTITIHFDYRGEDNDEGRRYDMVLPGYGAAPRELEVTNGGIGVRSLPALPPPEFKPIYITQSAIGKAKILARKYLNRALTNEKGFFEGLGFDYPFEDKVFFDWIKPCHFLARHAYRWPLAEPGGAAGYSKEMKLVVPLNKDKQDRINVERMELLQNLCVAMALRDRNVEKGLETKIPSLPGDVATRSALLRNIGDFATSFGKRRKSRKRVSKKKNGR